MTYHAWSGPFASSTILTLLVTTPAQADIQVEAGRGSVLVNVPPGYESGTPAPLVVLLHGYSGYGGGIDAYFGWTALSDELGFLYMYPDGSLDGSGNRFWNGTDACCDFFGSGIDDAGYLRALVEEVRGALDVDDRRIHFAGHSNGGFMSYRMACESADLVASVASLAGAMYADPADCAPAGPVHVLQVHGTADDVIRYGGGDIAGVAYPSAVETVEHWASFAGCSLVPDPSAPPLDLDSSVPGDETTVSRYETDCEPGGSAELWTINGGDHTPSVTDAFKRGVVAFLLSNPKPAAVDVSAALPPGRSPGLLAAPNPFRSRLQLRFTSPVLARGAVTIHDIAGRLVRQLAPPGGAQAGALTAGWDGTDGAGRAVPPGVYLIRVTLGDRHEVRQVVRMR